MPHILGLWHSFTSSILGVFATGGGFDGGTGGGSYDDGSGKAESRSLFCCIIFVISPSRSTVFATVFVDIEGPFEGVVSRRRVCHAFLCDK